MRAVTAAVSVVVAFAGAWQAEGRSRPPQRAAAADCVAIATPKPAANYVYERSQSNGIRSQYTQLWESVTATGSRVRVTGPRGSEVQISEHHIVDDVAVLDVQRKVDAAGGVIDATSFHPGIVSDPAFRACAGRSWPIPSVTATYRSSQANSSAATPAGRLEVLGIREKITVPAGQFDTVHYTRTSQSRDEYWKSIEHGVVVKHVATLPGTVVTEVLLSIR